MTDVEKIASFLQLTEEQLSGIRKDIAKLSADPSIQQTVGSLKEYFDDTLGITELYLRRIEDLLDRELVPLVEFTQMRLRLDTLEATVKENVREIAELKKRLAGPGTGQ